jgi:methionyl aminopeptidase
MIRYKTEEEIEILRKGGRILAKILKEVAKKALPGVRTSDLNSYAEKLIDEAGASAAFLGYKPAGARRPYPASICISTDEEIVHGIPGERILNEGDLVTLDLGLKFDGLITDAAITVPVGEVDDAAMRLIRATEEALGAGIKAMKLGGHIGDIGAAISKIAKKYNFAIADDLSGHGVGYNVHEEPFVPNAGAKGEGPELVEGLVIAIEPMFCEGSGKVKMLADGYTFVTRDGKRSAHFEHTVAVTKRGIEVLTAI